MSPRKERRELASVLTSVDLREGKVVVSLAAGRQAAQPSSLYKSSIGSCWWESQTIPIVKKNAQGADVLRNQDVASLSPGW